MCVKLGLSYQKSPNVPIKIQTQINLGVGGHLTGKGIKVSNTGAVRTLCIHTSIYLWMLGH